MNKKEDITYEYTGTRNPEQKVEAPDKRVYYPYSPSPDLIEAVNLAIALERPLLLEGEPGCGKTRLAGAVVYEFTQTNLENQKNEKGEQKWWDYYIWNIKSTTRARDGLYTYDAVARLRDAQLMGTDPQRLQEFLGDVETQNLKTRLLDKKNYLKLGPLGDALKEHPHRPILLIDEIDKADGDFANDLLFELEELRFEVPETGDPYPTPKHKPIIFITSNREKPLPEPFLRRCLYFFVNFPNEEQLRKIICQRFGQQGIDKKDIIDKAIEIFNDIRNLLKNVPGSRPPGTSEFIEFLTALLKKNVAEALKNLENLSNNKPLLGILVKTKHDQDLYSDKKKRLI